MSSQFTREQIKICIAKMCLTIGWHSSMTTPVEILADTLANYLYQLGKATHEYANGFGMTEPNLDHLGLAFRDFHVNLTELDEYVKYVDCVENATPVPNYPLPKENHLNFLKPGSKEVVTRHVHIHEHLPPMHPLLEEFTANENETELPINIEIPEDKPVVEDDDSIFKRPADIPQSEPFKRPRLFLEDEGRPTREISSVMMTTSGFLSPAREGRLPESRSPMVNVVEPESSLIPPANSDFQINKKPAKIIRGIDKKKDKGGKELFKASADPTNLVKKVTNVKEFIKNKMKTATSTNSSSANNFVVINDVNISLVPNNKTTSPNRVKFNKALAAARLKTEKLNTTITPIIPKPNILPIVPGKDEPHVDKLFTEPDKKKVNIFKKISVKNDKPEKVLKIKDEIKQESRESSPDLIIDESVNEICSKVHLSNDITIELINTTPVKSPEKIESSYFDDDSPPGTPSTPKTPEMISQSPPLIKVEKQKRKEKSKQKKLQKQASPTRLDTEIIDVDLERPKTPEAHLIPKLEKPELPAPPLAFPFFTPFGGPGLIPPPISNTLFPHLPIPHLGIPTFGQPPYISPVHPGLPMNFMQTLKQEEVIVKSPSPEKVPAISVPIVSSSKDISPKLDKKCKEHKKEKKEKLKKKKKDKIKNKAEKKKLKEEKKDKLKIKKEKKEKKKLKESRDCETAVPKLTLKLGSAPVQHEICDTRKLNIKPIIKKEEEPFLEVEIKRELSPELAKISALVTGQPKFKGSCSSSSSSINIPIKEEIIAEEVIYPQIVVSPRPTPGPGRPRIHPIKAKPTKLKKKQLLLHQLQTMDAEGNKVWICPACGKQDDGSPMIGCDDCDAWYHWVCVGIQVPPDDSEDWYCRLCISKKQEVLQTDKKKKRKKREKKEH